MRAFLLPLALGLASASCGALFAASETPEALPPPDPSAPAILGTGDVVEVKVYREPDLGGVYRVTDEGTVEFPLIGKLKLQGQSSDALAEEIRVRLSSGFLRDPQVSVFVREHNSHKIHVLGQVKKPGTFNFSPGMTIIQAITGAGGFTAISATNSVMITRAVNGKDERYVVPVGDIQKGKATNFEVQPGDIVYVPESLF